MINDRLNLLRKTLKISQEEFGNRLGVTGAAISRLEKGERNLTEQMLLSICREFSVNENWLRTGEDSMFMELSRAELAAKIVGNVIASDDEFVLNTFIALGQLSPAEWAAVKDFVKKIKDS